MDERLGYVLKRTLSLLIVIFLIANIIFVIFFIAPGDPAEILVPKTSDELLRWAVIGDLKLNESIPVQYVNYMEKMFTGEFFVSTGVMKGADIHEFVFQSLSYTLLLLIPITLISAALGILIELPMRKRTGKLADRFFQVLMAYSFCLPVIAVAMTLSWINVSADGPFPIFGNGMGHYEEDSGTLASIARHAVLPILGGIFSSFGGYALVARSTFVRNGHPRRSIPSRMPSVAIAKFLLPWTATVVIMIDIIFSYGGLGNMFIESIWRRDFPSLMVSAFLLGILIALIAYALDVLVVVERSLAPNSRSAQVSREAAKAPSIVGEPDNAGLSHVLREYSRSKTGVLALILVCIVLFMAAAAPLVSTVSNPMNYDRAEQMLLPGDPRLLPEHTDWRNPLPPSPSKSPYSGFIHPLGTDARGRDIYSMTVYAARDGVIAILVVAALSLIAGLIVWMFASALAGHRDLFAGVFEFLGLTAAELAIAMPLVVVGGVILATTGSGWFTARLLGALFMFALALPIVYFRARVSGLDRSLPGSRMQREESLRQWRAKNMFGARLWIETLHVAKFTTIIGFMSILCIEFLGLGSPSVPSWGQMLEDAYQWNAILGNWWIFIPPGIAAMVLAGSVYLVMDTFERILSKRSAPG